MKKRTKYILGAVAAAALGPAAWWYWKKYRPEHKALAILRAGWGKRTTDDMAKEAGLPVEQMRALAKTAGLTA